MIHEAAPGRMGSQHSSASGKRRDEWGAHSPPREIMLRKQLGRLIAWASPPPKPEPKKSDMRISMTALGYASVSPEEAKSPQELAERAFKLAQPMKGVLPASIGKVEKLAMDNAITDAIAYASINAAFSEGLQFLGYSYLSELTQRPEYRRPAEIIAKEMTREWIKIQGIGDDAQEAKAERIKELEDEFTRLNVQAVFREAIEQDGFFGRSQIYIDTGDGDDRVLLKAPLHESKNVLKKGALERIAVIEPIWTYPNVYNSSDPLKKTFFKPETWFVMGKEIHSSRLTTIVSRQVPDLLKPAYAFGGLSLTQMMKPYVDNWLRTRQSVSDLLHSFSVFGLKTDMSSILNMGGGEQLFHRAELFNKLRDNRGLQILNKDTEDFFNVSAPLGSLDHLQAQSQEHMGAVTGIPIVILLGLTPTGLNATQEGDIRKFYDWIAAQQEGIRPQITRIFNLAQLNIWGEVDPEITFKFEELWTLDAAQAATARKTDIEAGQILIQEGAIDPAEERERIAKLPDSPYPGLDLNKEITPPGQGEGDPGAGLGEEPGGEPGAPGSETADPGAKKKSEPRQVAGASDDFNESKIKRAPAGSSAGGQFVSFGGGGSITKNKPPQGLSPGKKAAWTKAANQALAAAVAKSKTEAIKTAETEAKINAAAVASVNVADAPKAMTPGQKAAWTKSQKKLASAGKAAQQEYKPTSTISSEAKKVAEWTQGAGFGLGFHFEKTQIGSGGQVIIYKKGEKNTVIFVLDGPHAGKWASIGEKGIPKIGVGKDVLTALLKGTSVPAGLINKHGATEESLLKELIGGTPKSPEEIAAEKQKQEAVKKIEAAQSEKRQKEKTTFHLFTKERPEPTPDQQAAINNYKGSGYQQINHELRFEHSPGINAKRITEWLDKASTQEDAVLYRGIRKEAALNLKSVLFPGAKIIDRGFMSMSAVEKFSEGWKGSGPHGLMMKINVPKGTKAAAVKQSSDSEYEVLAQRDTVIHVTSFDWHSGIVECTLLQPGIITQ